MANWNDLNFWKSTEWKNALQVLKRDKMVIVPRPRDVFRPLIETPLSKTRVMMIYPEVWNKPGLATGLALDFDRSAYGGIESEKYSPKPYIYHALSEELKKSYGHHLPKKGGLSYLSRQGVLLWNASPTTVVGCARTHGHLWKKLTTEMIETLYLYEPRTVFVFFGNRDEFSDSLPDDASVLELPSPISVTSTLFAQDSNIFAMINAQLKSMRRKPINWKD